MSSLSWIQRTTTPPTLPKLTSNSRAPSRETSSRERVNNGGSNMFEDKNLFGVEVKMMKGLMDQMEGQLRDRNAEVAALRAKLLDHGMQAHVVDKTNRMSDIIKEQKRKMNDKDRELAHLRKQVSLRDQELVERDGQLHNASQRIIELEQSTSDLNSHIGGLKAEAMQSVDRNKLLLKQAKAKENKQASVAASTRQVIGWLDALVSFVLNMPGEEIAVDKLGSELRIPKRRLNELITMLVRTQFVKMNAKKTAVQLRDPSMSTNRRLARRASQGGLDCVPVQSTNEELKAANTVLQGEVVRLQKETQAAMNIIDIATKLQGDNTKLKAHNKMLSAELQQLRNDTVNALQLLSNLQPTAPPKAPASSDDSTVLRPSTSEAKKSPSKPATRNASRPSLRILGNKSVSNEFVPSTRKKRSQEQQPSVPLSADFAFNFA